MREPGSDALEGRWRLERTGGLLPPLAGVRKSVRGGHGHTHVGPLPGLPFAVERRGRGYALRYHAPFSAFVDVVEPDGAGFSGRATLAGRTYGRFRMRPLDP